MDKTTKSKFASPKATQIEQGTVKKQRIEFAPKLQPLFKPKRYKVLYGGRGGGKSWGIARALLTIGFQKKTRILCAREFQNSISDSVHKLLSDQILEMGLSEFYNILQTSITGKNGTEFMFSGLRHNASKLKSFEAVDIVWVEEAQNVTKGSWEILIPTIRREGSEIWISFNPELEEDETFKRFVKHPPTDSTVLKINWDDNPWFPDVLYNEKEALRERDEDAYLHIWEGHCRQALEGAIYAKELRKAMQDGRVKQVPYMPEFPVHVFADLGWADFTSLWFVQKIGFEYHIIKAYQNRQEAWHHYMTYMRNTGYMIDTVWLPHDARAKNHQTGKTTEELTKTAGFKCRIVPNIRVEEGINAVRTIFPVLLFDEAGCADGLQALRRYRYDYDAQSNEFSRKPLHDDSSHFADALRYLAIGLKDKPEDTRPPKTIEISSRGFSGFGSGGGWMR